MKTSKEELLGPISDDLIIYLKSGKLSPLPFFNKFNLNINRIEDLLKIHFLLKEEVRQYIMKLQNRIRNLKTSTHLNQTIYHGKVKGNIDWYKTNNYRMNTNYSDKTVFVCGERGKLYNTKENIVLKKFLEILYDIIYKDPNMHKFSNYEWYVNGNEINQIVKHIYEKNVYINRIDINGINVTDRTIEDVSKNRNPLYREAAQLLGLYNRILNFDMDKEEANKLLKDTFIEISDENTLFELYWVINLIRNNTSNKEMYIVDGTNNMVAKWEDKKFIYKLYHDSTGSNNLLFSIGLDEIRDIDNSYLKRKIKVIEDTKTVAVELFGESDLHNNLWNGRPDILLEIFDKYNNQLLKVIIGEVKYTTDKNYSIKGLEELLEYIYFVKERNVKGKYILNNPHSNIDISGILFVDNIDFKPLDNQLIKVVNINEDNLKLKV